MPLTDTRFRVLIVAVYASVRAGLHTLLAESDGLLLVGQVAGSGGLERVLAEAGPDVVVCDAGEEDAVRVLQALGGRGIGAVVLDDAGGLSGALAASVLPGYALLRRDSDGPEISGAVHAVAAGLVVFDRGHAARLSAPIVASPALSGDGGGRGEGLTGREREVLQLMAQGLPNKQIAVHLGISPHTAKFHVAAVLAKLGASSRAEAVTLGARRGDLML